MRTSSLWTRASVDINRLSYLKVMPGEVAERLNAPVLKTGKPARVSWVRIPPSPPLNQGITGEQIAAQSAALCFAFALCGRAHAPTT
jgi:hypothetical protein